MNASSAIHYYVTKLLYIVAVKLKSSTRMQAEQTPSRWVCLGGYRIGDDPVGYLAAKSRGRLEYITNCALAKLINTDDNMNGDL